MCAVLNICPLRSAQLIQAPCAELGAASPALPGDWLSQPAAQVWEVQSDEESVPSSWLVLVATAAGAAAHGCSGNSLPAAVALHLSPQLCPGPQMLPSRLTGNAINTIPCLRYKRVPQVTP